MSEFWIELMTLSGTKLQFTTAYHPQTDGQSEVTNRALEQYLRAFTHETPKRWSEFLPWAELAMNCNINASIGMSPFQALYGREPPSIFRKPDTPARNADVSDLLLERSDILRFLKTRLDRAQQQMAASANRHRRDVAFKVGDRILLRLQPYRQTSVARPTSAKLAKRYYGPYTIVERIGKVAYHLQLPVDSRIHDVFHVSLLKPFTPPFTDTPQGTLPTAFMNNQPLDVPIRVTQERTILVAGIPKLQWLTYWSSNPEAPSWESREELAKHFPLVDLEIKAAVMEGGV